MRQSKTVHELLCEFCGNPFLEEGLDYYLDASLQELRELIQKARDTDPEKL